MCDINKETKLKTQIIYKVVRVSRSKTNVKYTGYFSHFPVKVGTINLRAARKTTSEQYKRMYDGGRFYNEHSIGRCSGFEDLKMAETLYKDSVWPGVEVAILKIKIAAAAKMPIMLGTGRGICDDMDMETCRVFAGPVIVSIKEMPPPRVPLR